MYFSDPLLRRVSVHDVQDHAQRASDGFRALQVPAESRQPTQTAFGHASRSTFLRSNR